MVTVVGRLGFDRGEVVDRSVGALGIEPVDPVQGGGFDVVEALPGAVGDAYDNALAESQIGLYKTELIRPEGPWKGLDDVEAATLDWTHWFNTERTHGSIDDLTPVEAEAAYYSHHQRQVDSA